MRVEGTQLQRKATMSRKRVRAVDGGKGRNATEDKKRGKAEREKTQALGKNLADKENQAQEIRGTV